MKSTQFPLRKIQIYNGHIEVPSSYADEFDLQNFFDFIKNHEPVKALEWLEDVNKRSPWQLQQLNQIQIVLLMECGYQQPLAGNEFFELYSKIIQYQSNANASLHSFLELKNFLATSITLKDLTPYFTEPSLNIREQKFSLEGIKSLANSLAENKTLTALSLRSPNFNANLLFFW